LIFLQVLHNSFPFFLCCSNHRNWNRSWPHSTGDLHQQMTCRESENIQICSNSQITENLWDLLSCRSILSYY
jgi:hypothetical protein